MVPDGYVKKAIGIAMEAGLLAEVMEYALNTICEGMSPFEAVNYALDYYKLPMIPEKEQEKVYKITVNREENWQEPFRVEYDGKYLTLFGRDTNYQVPDYGGHGQVEYEEMVLVPVIKEIRDIIPRYANCDGKNIEIGYVMKSTD